MSPRKALISYEWTSEETITGYPQHYSYIRLDFDPPLNPRQKDDVINLLSDDGVAFECTKEGDASIRILCNKKVAESGEGIHQGYTINEILEKLPGALNKTTYTKMNGSVTTVPHLGIETIELGDTNKFKQQLAEGFKRKVIAISNQLEILRDAYGFPADEKDAQILSGFTAVLEKTDTPLSTYVMDEKDCVSVSNIIARITALEPTLVTTYAELEGTENVLLTQIPRYAPKTPIPRQLDEKKSLSASSAGSSKIKKEGEVDINPFKEELVLFKTLKSFFDKILKEQKDQIAQLATDASELHSFDKFILSNWKKIRDQAIKANIFTAEEPLDSLYAKLSRVVSNREVREQLQNRYVGSDKRGSVYCKNAFGDEHEGLTESQHVNILEFWLVCSFLLKDCERSFNDVVVEGLLNADDFPSHGGMVTKLFCQILIEIMTEQIQIPERLIDRATQSDEDKKTQRPERLPQSAVDQLQALKAKYNENLAALEDAAAKDDCSDDEKAILTDLITVLKTEKDNLFNPEGMEKAFKRCSRVISNTKNSLEHMDPSGFRYLLNIIGILLILPAVLSRCINGQWRLFTQKSTFTQNVNTLKNAYDDLHARMLSIKPGATS